MEQALQHDRRLEAYFVDTATESDLSADVRAVEHFRDQILEGVGFPSVSANGLHLVADTEREPTRERLLANTEVQRVLESEALDAWWLEDDRAFLSPDGFEHGTMRRRGLAKALYHYCRADEADPLEPLDGLSSDSTAMVVGLGGGTGSGLAIDIGQEMDTHAHITLFAVLPGDDATAAESANAYATLVELERLVLEDENPFSAIVLVPEGPSDDYEEFDEALAYTLAAYYNSENRIPNVWFSEKFDGNPDFAPFTVAVPQVINYAAGEIAFDERVDAIERRLEALDREATLLNEIEAFLANHYPERFDSAADDGTSPDTPRPSETAVDQDLHTERLRPLKELLESDFVRYTGLRTQDEEVRTFVGGVLEAWNEGQGDRDVLTVDGLDALREAVNNDHWAADLGEGGAGRTAHPGVRAVGPEQRRAPCRATSGDLRGSEPSRPGRTAPCALSPERSGRLRRRSDRSRASRPAVGDRLRSDERS